MGLYDDIPGGYYLNAMLYGYPVQRFWHKSKLAEISKYIPDNPNITLLDLGCGAHITLNNDGKLILTTPNYSSFWWLIEHLWRLVSPIKYKEHHINMFTLSRLRKFVNMAGFKIKELKTLFLITPFIALFSEALAQKLLPYEQKIIGQFGLIIFAVLEKQKQL